MILLLRFNVSIDRAVEVSGDWNIAIGPVQTPLALPEYGLGSSPACREIIDDAYPSSPDNALLEA